MCVLIGGSGSSGSTMLLQKLSTHPSIFAGPELNFFNKEQLFENWNANKLKIIPFLPFFTTKGWQIYRRNTLAQAEYGWTKPEMKQLLKESNSMMSFVNHYFARPMSKSKATTWVEKTPSNVYSFVHFLDAFPQGKVIHIVRNPLDSMASMYRKDDRVFYGAGTWLYNNAVGLASQHNDRYYRVKYEDIVYNPEKTFDALCDFIGVNNGQIELNLGGSEKKIESWFNSPYSKISTSSMGNFDALEDSVKRKIYTALHYFEISKSHATHRSLSFTNYEEICAELEYSYQLFPEKNMLNTLKNELKRDRFTRTLKRYATGGHYYPLEIRKHL